VQLERNYMMVDLLEEIGYMSETLESPEVPPEHSCMMADSLEEPIVCRYVKVD